LFLSLGFSPTFFHRLTGAAESERVCRNIVRDARSRGNIGARADAHGRDQRGVAADEGAVFDYGLLFVGAVVVAGDGAGADVHAIADFGVAEIGEVVGFGSFAEADFLGLDEVADVGGFSDEAFGAEVRVGSEDGAGGDGGLVDDAAGTDGYVVGESGVADDGIRTDAAIAADGGAAEELNEGLDNGVGPDGDVGVDDAGFGAVDGDARGHQVGALAVAELGVETGEFGACVDAEDFDGVIGGDGDDTLFGAGEDLGHVGEVELAVSVVGGEVVDVGEQGSEGEGVEAGVDLTETGFALGGGEGFFFDDLNDLAVAGFLLAVDDAAVAEGVFGEGSQQRHGGAALEVGVVQAGEGFGADEGGVAGEDQGVVVVGECVAGHHEGVAGTSLFRLENELDAGGGDGLLYAVSFVADDGVNVAGGNKVPGGVDDVLQEGLAADLVQDFGEAGFEACAFSGGEDDDGETGGDG